MLTKKILGSAALTGKFKRGLSKMPDSQSEKAPPKAHKDVQLRTCGALGQITL